MTESGISGFASTTAEQRFATRYEMLVERLMPRDREAIDMRTSYGITRTYRMGAAGGPPLVLLPGAAANALMWHPYLTRWAGEHQVVAVDPVGEPGGSRQSRPIRDDADLTAWLGEVLDGLGVERTHLVGCSYGAWTALHYCLASPERVATLALLEPAGFAPMSFRFVLWLIAGGVAALGPRRLRRWAARPLNNATLHDDDLMALARAAAGFRRRLPAPSLVTDDELRAITPSTLVVLGGRSPLHDAARVAARIDGTVSTATTEVVPSAGHDLPLHSVERVAARVSAFLAAGEPA